MIAVTQSNLQAEPALLHAWFTRKGNTLDDSARYILLLAMFAKLGPVQIDAGA